MKTLFLILLPIMTIAQSNFRLNETESFNIGVTLDPYASYKNNGLCIGAEIEYQGTAYVRAGFTSFSKLNYTDIIGAFGLTFTSGYFEKTTYYSGIRLGVIIREATNATAGFEAGINQKLSDKVIIGLRGCYDYRSDWKMYGINNGSQYSTFLKLAIVL